MRLPMRLLLAVTLLGAPTPAARAAPAATTPAATTTPNGPARGGRGLAWPAPSFAAARPPCVRPSLRRVAPTAAAPTGPSFGPQAALAAAPLVPYRAAGGNPYEDLFPGIFVDVDPAPFASRDFSCRDFTYDGHAGHDLGLRSFAEQLLGVPVFAVRDGAVVFAKDGFPDMNTQPGLDDGNYVGIDHGGGQVSWYFHLRKNSVLVSVGQVVVAGQPIGQVGSSGYSYGPHLHFEVQEGGAPIEPMGGPCSQPQSRFDRQPPLVLDTVVFDFGITTQDLFQAPGLPLEQPKQAQIPLNAGFLYFWMQVANIPAGATWRVRFLRPDASVALDSGTQPWGNAQHERYWPGFFYWWVPDVQTIPGTWRYRFDFDGVTAVDAPFDVVASPTPGFNRAPEPIGAAFDPPSPSPDDAVFARVTGSLVTDDLDWDVVRYRYRWTVGGQVVRDVTHAGRADAIAKGVASAGQVVACTITASDGKADGAPVTIQATSRPNPWTAVAGGTYGQAGVPHLAGDGPLTAGSAGSLTLVQARPNSASLLFLAANASALPLLGGTFVPAPVLTQLVIPNGPQGGFTVPFVFPAGVPTGVTLALQAWIADADATFGVASTNGLVAVTP